MANKTKNNKMSSAVVVYKPQQQLATKSKKKKTKKNKKSPNASSSDLIAYKMALTNPFSPLADGARVPDQYSAPTVPKHFNLSWTITTNASGAADIVILPNLYMNALSTRGSVSGFTTWDTMDGLTTNLAYVTPTSTIAAQLSNYRIVGYGVRVYTTSSLTASSGRLLAATTAVSSWVNKKSATIGGQTANSSNAGASVGNTISSYGLPVASGLLDPTQMPTMMNCVETSLTGLASSPMVITPKITSPEAFEFRQSQDSSIGFQINNQTSASYVSSGDASYLRVAGHELVALSITGGPASTAVVQVELTVHVEGTPVVTALVGDSPKIVAAPTAMAEIIAAAARSEPFKRGLEVAGNVVYPGLGTFAKNLMK